MNVPLSRLFHNRVARSVRPDVFSQRRDEVRSIFRRSREVVLLAAATGIATGLFVRGLDVAVHAVYDRLFEAPLWMLLTAPVSGLLVAALSLRYIGGGISGSTSDEYLQSFHDSQYRLGLRALVARSVAAIASLGTGGSLGLEGPSLYGGSTLGEQIQRRLPAPFRGSDHRTLLVAGAAAGVAAIFKAPATGAIFALEVPYRDDLARRMLLPALVASATGYFTFVSLSDTTPLLGGTIIPIPQFEVRDLFGALAIGGACAIGARAFAKLIRFAKSILGALISDQNCVGVGNSYWIGAAVTRTHRFASQPWCRIRSPRGVAVHRGRYRSLVVDRSVCYSVVCFCSNLGRRWRRWGLHSSCCRWGDRRTGCRGGRSS